MRFSTEHSLVRACAIALCVYSAGCASSGRSAPKPFPSPPIVSGPTAAPPETPPLRPEPSAATRSFGDVVMETALALRGIPYRNGGSDLRGFDCSGFTQYVFAQSGTPLPRETREQFEVGEPVPIGQQQPGDLIFFTTTAAGASHVGIAIGGDMFVHAPSSRGVVRTESLTLPYWSRRVLGVRRIEAN